MIFKVILGYVGHKRISGKLFSTSAVIIDVTDVCEGNNLNIIHKLMNRERAFI